MEAFQASTAVRYAKGREVHIILELNGCQPVSRYDAKCIAQGRVAIANHGNGFAIGEPISLPSMVEDIEEAKNLFPDLVEKSSIVDLKVLSESDLSQVVLAKTADGSFYKLITIK